jgi:hypothetical protein
MTTPFERTRAVLETKSFLLKLVDTKRLPRVPKSVREHAQYLLRHYPSYLDIDTAHTTSPDLFGPSMSGRLLDDALPPHVQGKK